MQNNSIMQHTRGAMKLILGDTPSVAYRRKVEQAIRNNADLFATIYISKSDVGEKFIATVKSLTGE